jgi:hypothetical protein
MTLGCAPQQESLERRTTEFCEGKLSPTSIYSLLHRECHRLFPDESFADLFRDTGRRSIPPRIVAVVMVLQRLEGLSDREAVERFTFDVRWKYAAGGLDLEYPGFVHTVLVDMRARLRASKEPERIFKTVLEVAKSAGLVGRRRVLDSTPLYDAVATQDTVTMIPSKRGRTIRLHKHERQLLQERANQKNPAYALSKADRHCGAGFEGRKPFGRPIRHRDGDPETLTRPPRVPGTPNRLKPSYLQRVTTNPEAPERPCADICGSFMLIYARK